MQAGEVGFVVVYAAFTSDCLLRTRDAHLIVVPSCHRTTVQWQDARTGVDHAIKCARACSHLHTTELCFAPMLAR